jgi:hypothetical protein
MEMGHNKKCLKKMLYDNNQMLTLSVFLLSGTCKRSKSLACICYVFFISFSLLHCISNNSMLNMFFFNYRERERERERERNK